MDRLLFALACLTVSDLVAGSFVTSRNLSIPALAGCGKSLPNGQAVGTVSHIVIQSGGYQRTYNISIPATYHADIPTPLILSYHGGLKNSEDQMKLDQLTNPYFNNVSIVVYPQGINNTWQGVPGVTTNDIEFTTDIINEVQSLYCIDPGRITATGKSDGGGFCNVLACDPVLSKRLAAFAPVSGAYYIDELPCVPPTVNITCSPGRTDVPLLAFHGGNDTTIPYLGEERKKECLPTVPHAIQEWAARDGLGSSNITTPVAADTVKYTFGNGTKTGLVGLFYESNIGHDWPSTEPNADNTVPGHHVANYNATPIILEFFKLHPLSILEEAKELI